MSGLTDVNSEILEIHLGKNTSRNSFQSALGLQLKPAITHLPFSFDCSEKLRKGMTEDKQDTNTSPAAAPAKVVAVV